METMSKLREERQRLVARLEEIDKILRRYEELDREANRLLSPLTDSLANEVENTGGPQDNRTTVANIPMRWRTRFSKTPVAAFERAVIEVLQEADGPMDRVAIYEALKERGITVGSGDRERELNVVSARVYRMALGGQLEGVRGQGYRLKTDTDRS